MGRRKSLPVLEDVEITDIAAEGNAIARANNKILFVPQAIPGDIHGIQVTRKRTSFMEGYIVKLKKPSPLRIEPFCEHFGICGGCKWQHLPYPEQLKWKQKQVTDSLQRIGKVTIEKINNILASDNTRFYRNKLEYTFSDNKWLDKEQLNGTTFIKEPGAGFHIPGMFDKVLDIHYCYHQPDPSNQIRLSLKDFAISNHLEFFNLKTKQGFLRNLIIRNTSIEDFVPFDPAGKRAGLYCCGPTVHDFAHIGNFRTFVFADLVRRYLQFRGFAVRHVMNITDVEDKIIRRVRETKTSAARLHRQVSRRRFLRISRRSAACARMRLPAPPITSPTSSP